MPEHRSGCPINLATEVLGDKWTLVVLRDLMFGNKRYYRELLHNSLEGIASNILADRLQRLVTNGLVSRTLPTRRTSRRSATASPSRPFSSCRSWPTSARGETGTYQSAASLPSTLSFSRPAAPNCGIGLWTSYAATPRPHPVGWCRIRARLSPSLLRGQRRRPTRARRRDQRSDGT